MADSKDGSIKPQKPFTPKGAGLQPSLRVWLDDNVERDFKIFEYGSDGTIMFAGRCKELHTLVHEEQWKTYLENELYNRGHDYVNIYCIHEDYGRQNKDYDDPLAYSSPDDDWVPKVYKSYVTKIEDFENDYFDLILVSGKAKPSCLFHASTKVAVGGHIVLTDASQKNYRKAAALYDNDRWVETFLQGRKRRQTALVWTRQY